MDFNKVLFILQEISPYLPKSEMGEFSRLLAQRVQENGAEVRTFMPKYGYVNDRRNQLHPVIRLSGMNLIIDDMDHPLIIKVATLQPARLQVYFIFSDDYFTPEITKELETNSHPEDNDERSIFYVRGVLEAVKKQRWAPGIIHCSGWITALAPLYIEKIYGDDPSFRDSKVVMSLFDEQMVSPLSEDLYKKLKFDGFSDEELAPIMDKSASYVDLMRLALEHCHAVVQCSEHVNEEVGDDESLSVERSFIAVGGIADAGKLHVLEVDVACQHGISLCHAAIDKGIGANVHAHVLHAYQGTLAHERHTEGSFHGRLLVGAPLAVNAAFSCLL